ncbi:MAG: LamG domain-containing protein [Planctomycetota bacterium]|jgi:hypothetical protein
MRSSSFIQRRLVLPAITGLAFFGPTLVAGQNLRPVADAGLARYAGADPVQLDGRGSYDPDESGALSYTWRQVSGPAVTITGADTATPEISGLPYTDERGRTISGPFVQTEAIQECEFELVVEDGELASWPDTVRVAIVPTFTNCTMTLENAFFDPDKPTLLFFGGGTSEQTGGSRLNRPLWSEKANVISFPSYVADPGTFSGAQTERSYMRPGDMIIVYLSAVAPDYHQPIQTLGFSIGGLLALDVALHLNVTYADARYAVNHACLLDPSAWVMGTPEFHRRVALLLANPVAEEPCWVASLEAANASVCPSALNIVFAPDHVLPRDWYLNSLEGMEGAAFDHGVLGGAYWSVVGPGRNLQLALTPGVETYKFRWIGSATAGQMELYDELKHPGRLPEPVTLGAWVDISEVSGDIDGAVLSCHESENAAGYQLLLGSDPHRVMDFEVVSDTPLPPMDVVRDLPSDETWWTIRVRDQFGSTVHADPVRLDLASLAPLPVENTRLGRRYGLIAHAMLEAEPGDEILLDPVTYEETIAFGAKPVTIRSLDPNDPVTVAGTIIAGRDGTPTVTFSGPESTACALTGLTIQNSTLAISCRDAVPTLRNCVIECPDGIAIEFWHGYTPRLIDCTLLGRTREGGNPGLLAYWKLDETEGSIARDSEGDQDGTLVGEPVWQPNGGKVGGALQFDGATLIAVDTVLNPADGPFSVLAWVKCDTAGQVILSQTGGNDWLLTDSSGALMTDLKGSGRRAKALYSQAVITDGQWHRIGLAWDGLKRTLYVDEVAVAEDEPGLLPDVSEGLHIGAGADLEPSRFFSGLIDDVRIYSRAVSP